MSDLARACEDLVGFAGRLRAAGLKVSYPQVELAAQSLMVDEGGDEEFAYWALRSALTSSPEEIALFDWVLSGETSVGPPTEQQGEEPAPEVGAAEGTKTLTVSSSSAGEEAEEGEDESDDDSETSAPGFRFSAYDRLRSLDFSLYGPEEERLANAVIRRLAGRLPEQVSRRQQESRRGRKLDFRRTFHRSVRTGGHPVDLAWSGPRMKPRRVVILIDISGSMQAYAAPMLVMGHALRSVSRMVEVFTFGTRLTHMSREALSATSHTAWTEAVGREVPDWAGGTRIGASLAAYNRGWGRRGLSRGAVITIFSDGWERGSLEEISKSMAEVNRFAHRTLWLNPLAAREGYEPLAGGMAAALPYVDRLMPAASIADLEDYIDEMAGARADYPGALDRTGQACYK